MSQEDTSCPICFEEPTRDNYVVMDCMRNHYPNNPAACSHWFCCECLGNCLNLPFRVCPICRADISPLLETYESDTEEEEEEDNDADNEEEGSDYESDESDDEEPNTRQL